MEHSTSIDKPAKKNRRKRGKKPASKGADGPTAPPPAPPKAPSAPPVPAKTQNGPASSSCKPPNPGSTTSNYPPHFAADVALQLVSRCPEDFIAGTFRINAKSYKDAYVSHPDPQSADIHVFDFPDRNRAMNNDRVLVQLKPKDQWTLLHDKIQAYLREQSQADRLGPAELALMTSALDLKAQGQGVSAVEYPRDAVLAHPLWKNFVQPTAKVVSILEARHTRLAAGRLRKFPDGNPNFALFAPEDSRVPRMKVPRGDCPPEFFARPQDFQDMLFIGAMTRWDMGHTAFGKISHPKGDR